jgi:membrane-associated phospholipid phosphatase
MLKNKCVISVAVLAILAFERPAAAFPQPEEINQVSEPDHLNGPFLKKFGTDFVSVLASPGRWKSSDLLTFAAVAGTGILFYTFDGEIYDWVQGRRSEFSREASTVISKLGNGGILTAFIAGLYTSGEIFDEPGLRKTALLSLESFLTTSAVVLGLKVATGRARPNTGEAPDHFHPFSLTTRHTSFPSGDAAGAFAVATTIAGQSSDTFVDVCAYGLAGLVAIYRVHDQKHWPSDVLVGSALGFFIARKISRFNERGRAELGISIQWTARERSIGFTLGF